MFNDAVTTGKTTKPSQRAPKRASQRTNICIQRVPLNEVNKTPRYQYPNAKKRTPLLIPTDDALEQPHNQSRNYALWKWFSQRYLSHHTFLKALRMIAVKHAQYKKPPFRAPAGNSGNSEMKYNTNKKSALRRFIFSGILKSLEDFKGDCVKIVVNFETKHLFFPLQNIYGSFNYFWMMSLFNVKRSPIKQFSDTSIEIWSTEKWFILSERDVKRR